MDQMDNTAFLHDTLKYLGFGGNSVLHFEMEEQIKKEPEAFELYTDAFFDEETKMEATLYFFRSKKEPRYFLNKYYARLKFADEPLRNKEQMIYIERNRLGISFKEAFNLLHGRFVYRKWRDRFGETYMSWVQLDFAIRELSGNYKIRHYYDHFDLKKALQTCPIVELAMDELQERICRSLQRGNLHPVTYMLKSGKTEKKYIYAHPAQHTINNLSEATRASRKRGTHAILLSEVADIDHDAGESLSESVAQDGVPAKAQKAHL